MKPTRFLFRTSVASACLIVLAFSSQAIHAAAPNWNTAVSGNWTDTALWSTAAVPVAGDTVTFNAAAQNGAELIYLNGSQAAASLTFTNTGTTGLLGGISGTPANNTLTLTAGIIQNAGAGAVTIGDTAVSPTDKVDLILIGNQSIDGRSTAGTLTIANSLSGAGVVLTTNGGGGGTIAASNTIFKGAVTLGSLAAQGNNGTNGTYQIIRTTTFDGATLGTTGNVSVGRSNIVFSGASTANITGNIVSSASWGSLTIQGSSSVTAANVDMKVGDNATGQLNLFGGTLTTGSITAMDRQAGGDNGAAVTFNGTQVIASQANNAFLAVTNGAGGGGFSPATAAYIATGGALLNSNGFNIGIASNLKDFTSSQLTAGIGKGGVGVIAATAGAGFLTKSGAGSLTLSGNNTYTGATTVNGGTLVIAGSGTINGSSGITVNGSGAKYLHTGSTASTRTITLTQGSVDGTGFLGAVNVGAGTGGIVTNGTTSANGTLSGGTGTLTMSSLSFGGAAAVSANVATAEVPALSVTGAVTTTGAGTVTVNASINGSWTNGTVYRLIDFGSLGGTGASAFTLGNVANLGARQVATLTNSGFIGLSIAGDVPKWTGLKNTSWTTTAQGSPFNWQLATAGIGTEFQTNDLVLFDDTAAGSGTVSVTIPTANVSVVGVTFNNNSKNYSITGSFGITGSGSLIKNGSGTTTLGTPNSYTGGTAVNDGSLALSGSGTLGSTSGTLTFNGGTLKLGGTSQTVGSVTLFPAFVGNTIENGTISASSFSSAFETGTATVAAGLSGNGTLTQSGLGTLVLAGASNHTGATEVTAGSLEVTGSLSGSNVTVSGFGLLNLSGTITGSNTTINGSGFPFLQTSTGVIAGAGNTLTVNAGTSTLDGTNTYSGNTILNGGTLLVGNTSALGSGTLVFNGGVLGASDAGASLANPITLAAGTTLGDGGNSLTLSGNITKATGGTSAFAGFGTTTLAGTNTFNYDAVDSHLTLNGGTTVSITGTTTISSSANSAGAVRCFGGSSLTIAPGGTLNVTGTAAAIKGDSLIGHLSSSTLLVSGGNLNYSANSAIFLGNGGFGQGTLTIDSGSATFLAGPSDGTSATAFLLTGRQGATGTINLNGGVLATDRTIARNGGNTADTGNAIFNFNGGTLRALASNSDWLNSTTRVGVTNNVGVPNAFNVYPMSSTTVSTGGAVIDTNGFDIGINTVLSHDALLDIAPDGGLTKNGAGTLTLGAASTYTGPTLVNAGNLRVNGSLDAASAVTVSTSTRLEGTGTAAGPVTAAGTIAPGSSGIGTLSTGSTTLTGTLATELDGSTGDQLLVAGDLTITGATLTFTQLSAPTGGRYVVAKYTGTLTGTFSTSTVPSGYTLSYDATAKEIIISKPGFSGFMDGFVGLTAGEKTAAADPDSDGISNLVEYALAGFDPTIANGSPGTLSGLLLTFNKRALAVSNGDVQYKIEESTSLTAGSWSEVVATESDTAISHTLVIGQPKKFARLKVTQITP